MNPAIGADASPDVAHDCYPHQWSPLRLVLSSHFTYEHNLFSFPTAAALAFPLLGS